MLGFIVILMSKINHEKGYQGPATPPLLNSPLLAPHLYIHVHVHDLVYVHVVFYLV